MNPSNRAGTIIAVVSMMAAIAVWLAPGPDKSPMLTLAGQALAGGLAIIQSQKD